MNLKVFPLLLVPVLVGCLGPAPMASENWMIECASVPQNEIVRGAEIVRLAQVNVRAPFDGRGFAVLRPDGSVAFDAFNGFASPPAALIRGAAEDFFAQTPVYRRVVSANSAAGARYVLEISVTRIALDCRREGRRDASVALSLVVLDGRTVQAVHHGEASSPTDDGNYSAAFSRAFTDALAAAFLVPSRE